MKWQLSVCCEGCTRERQKPPSVSLDVKLTVRGAARDATSQGPHAKKAFGMIRRAGGPAFCEAIRLYKSKCQGSGMGYRRPRFAWVKYQMLLETKSEMQWGFKSVYVTEVEVSQDEDGR